MQESWGEPAHRLVPDPDPWPVHPLVLRMLITALIVAVAGLTAISLNVDNPAHGLPSARVAVAIDTTGALEVRR